MLNEFILIEKVKRGNKRAFKKLFDSNAEKLYRFLSKYSEDDYLVDDWVQRAFVKAYLNIDKFEGRSKFSTWLFKIGINEMKTDLRKFSKNTAVSIEDDKTLRLMSEENEFEWRNEMKILISELDEYKRAAFILYEVEGYSHSEIAEMLSISESASRINLFRARKILQESFLKQRGAI